MTRRQEREQAFMLIFEKCFRDEAPEEILDDALGNEFYKESKYSEDCFKGTIAHIADIDPLIEANLKGWKMERISKMALSILRLAIYEIRFVDSVPPSVSINEAVELAKIYSNEDEGGFINGVLGSVVRAENA